MIIGNNKYDSIIITDKDDKVLAAIDDKILSIFYGIRLT